MTPVPEPALPARRVLASDALERLATPVLMGSAMLWGVAWWPMQRLATLGVSGALLSLLAYGGVGLLSLPWLWRDRIRIRARLRQWLLIAAFSGTGASCFVLAMSTGDVAREMLLFYLAPAWSVLGGRLFLGERLGWPRVLAVTIAVAGAACVIRGRGPVSAGSLTIEDLFALVAGITFAAGNLCTRAADSLSLVTKTSAQILGCGVISGLIVALGTAPIPPLGATAVGGVVAFALVWIVGGTSTTAFGVSHIEAGRAALIILAELVTAVVTASLFQRRVPALLELAGALLILAAAVLDGVSSANPRRLESS